MRASMRGSTARSMPGWGWSGSRDAHVLRRGSECERQRSGPGQQQRCCGRAISQRALSSIGAVVVLQDQRAVEPERAELRCGLGEASVAFGEERIAQDSGDAVLRMDLIADVRPER